MREKIIKEKIKHLQDIKKRITSDTLLPEDLPYIYDKVEGEEALFYTKREMYTHFYTKEKNQKEVHLVEEGIPYEKSISFIQPSFDETSLTVSYQDASQKYGAFVLLSNPPKWVPVYEPTFTSVKTVGDLFVALKDERGKLYESIVSLKGNVFSVKEKGKYRPGFSLQKCFLFASKNPTKEPILYYEGVPIYLYSYGFSRKRDLEKFISAHGNRIHPDFLDMASHFDESFIEENTGYQKHL